MSNKIIPYVGVEYWMETCNAINAIIKLLVLVFDAVAVKEANL